MNLRKIIISILGVLLIIGAVLVFKKMTAKESLEEQNAKNVVQSIYAEKVENKDINIMIESTGKLSAKRKTDLFSEVQGISHATRKEFKPGIKYFKGETLIHINSDEFVSNIKAKRSALQNTISAFLPDLRLDFPDQFLKWESYLNSININSTLNSLPSFGTDKEKYFIASKNVSVKYFEIKNLEEKLKKFTIRAPYTGIVTQANINTGTLISPNQKLGQFIDPSIYELEISLSNDKASLLKIGDMVEVSDINDSNSWQGKVIRKNAIVDQSTQTKNIFVQLKNKKLSDGMYLKAKIKGNKQTNVLEIDRSLLVNDSYVYLLKDNVLKLKEIQIIHFNEKTAIVKGLDDGEMMISKIVPGAFEGMAVTVVNN